MIYFCENPKCPYHFPMEGHGEDLVHACKTGHGPLKAKSIQIEHPYFEPKYAYFSEGPVQIAPAPSSFGGKIQNVQVSSTPKYAKYLMSTLVIENRTLRVSLSGAQLVIETHERPVHRHPVVVDLGTAGAIHGTFCTNCADAMKVAGAVILES